ncbi:MAG: glycosyltransferase family 2 protein [Oligoflexia bacterium]|nr:glycosyltransferase family 2 protein [Oligoflexia bacterium]
MRDELISETKESEAMQLYRPLKIAVLIPAYNEEKNIETVLEEIQKLRTMRPRWNILPIVVNDGSKDRTEQVLGRIAPQYGAYAIHLPLNLGIGRAVQTGFKYAVRWGADVALQLDGDGQHPPDQIPAIVDPVLQRKADVVVGSRYVTGAGGNVSSLFRQAGTMFFSVLLKLLVGVEIKDTTSGYRAFNRDAIEYLSRCYPDDYPEVEAYVLLARKRFTMLEVPVRMRHRMRGSSSITPLKSAYYMIKVAFSAAIGMIRPLPDREITVTGVIGGLDSLESKVG